jgi:WhiB family redox-sensing transcriptional regulator
MSARDAVLAETMPEVPAPDWSAALCAQADPDAWHPEQGASVRDPKRICRSCPITDECGEWALATRQRWGVWGGMTERERRRELRRRSEAVMADA